MSSDYFVTDLPGRSDVLDMKRPGAILLAGGTNRRRASFALCDALAQVETYARFFEEPLVRDHLHEMDIRVLRPARSC
jgi:hypothetical protein